MNKITKKFLALLISAVMLFTPVAVYADEAELGAEENPYVVTASDARGIRVYVEPGQTKWVQADISSSTVTVGYATTPDYRINYNGRNFLPETESGDNTLHFGISDKTISFSVINTGSEDVLVCMTVAPGEYVDPTGTVNYPEAVIFEENMYTGALGAMLERPLAASNNGYHFELTAPADGIISVFVTAYDAEFNDLGWMYNASNTTSGKYGASHYSTDTDVIQTELVEVSAGDKVLIVASTFDPSTPFANPEGTVFVMISFAGIGSIDCPEEITEPGMFADEQKSGNQGYYYAWTAEATGSVTIEMLDADGWQYSINVECADGEYVYGDLHWPDDEPVVPSETHEVEEGDVLTIFIATYDPNMWWSNPAGTVNWSLTFKEASSAIIGDLDGDEDITTKDVLTLRKYLAGLITELDVNATAAADCDGDGDLTTKDVLCIRKYLAGLIEELPYVAE